MASSSPRTATSSWLLHAANKLEKSIYRKVEHKYRNLINSLTTRVKELEDLVKSVSDEAIRYEDFGDKQKFRIQELEGELRTFKQPVVEVDLREELFQAKPITEQTIPEESVKEVKIPKKVSTKPTVEKICEVSPSPQSILLPPDTNKKSKKRERSTSPKSERRIPRVPAPSEDTPTSLILHPSLDTALIPSSPHPFRPLVYPPVLISKKKKRKRKRGKDDV